MDLTSRPHWGYAPITVWGTRPGAASAGAGNNAAARGEDSAHGYCQKTAAAVANATTAGQRQQRGRPRPPPVCWTARGRLHQPMCYPATVPGTDDAVGTWTGHPDGTWLGQLSSPQKKGEQGGITTRFSVTPALPTCPRPPGPLTGVPSRRLRRGLWRAAAAATSGRDVMTRVTANAGTAETSPRTCPVDGGRPGVYHTAGAPTQWRCRRQRPRLRHHSSHRRPHLPAWSGH